MKTHLPTRTRIGAVVGLTATAMFALGTTTASAHVVVKPDSIAAGSFSALTFRVPNESATASTTKLVVTLPETTPFAFVSVRPVPGWTAKVTEGVLPKPITSHGATITKAARTVTWEAASKTAAIGPGEYQEFAISAGPLPDPGTLVLPAQQTYSDGTVVDWDQVQIDGDEEPDHPAPHFDVVAAGATTSPPGTASTPAPANPPATAKPASATTTKSSDTVARLLGGTALLLAVAGFVASVVLGRRRFS